jgi:hypothetical protein
MYSSIFPAVEPHNCVTKPVVRILLSLSEINYLIKLLLNLRPPHPQNCTVQKDILPASQFGVKARTDFHQTGDPSLDPETADGWFG